MKQSIKIIKIECLKITFYFYYYFGIILFKKRGVYIKTLYSGQNFKEVSDFYDGYNFNGTHVYNPWSIVSYAETKELIPYWVNTGSNDFIRRLLNNLSYENRLKIEKLFLNESINLTIIQNYHIVTLKTVMT